MVTVIGSAEAQPENTAANTRKQERNLELFMVIVGEDFNPDVPEELPCPALKARPYPPTAVY